jgi:uncharacterized membrane protein
VRLKTLLINLKIKGVAQVTPFVFIAVKAHPVRGCAFFVWCEVGIDFWVSAPKNSLARILFVLKLVLSLSYQVRLMMKQTIVAIYNFYREGFRNMTWGRQLWWVILLKVVILFLVLRTFFFQPILSGKSEEQKIEHVSNELIRR